MRADRRTWSAGRPLVVLGWVAMAFWLSQAVFPYLLPPLRSMPDLGAYFREHPVAPWIWEKLGQNQPDEDVFRAMNRQLMLVIAVQWIWIALGVASGVLLVLRRRVGWWLAAVVCGIALARAAGGQLRMLRESHLVEVWTVAVRVVPLVAMRWAMDLAFYVATIAVLARHRIRSGTPPAPGTPTSA
jgi:hypothetical protein